MRKLIDLPEEKIMEHLRWGAETWKSAPGEIYKNEVDRHIEDFLTPLCENAKQLECYLRIYEGIKNESK